MPFARRKPVLALDAETREQLQTLSVSRTAPAAQVERARMLLGWHHSGFSVHRGRVRSTGRQNQIPIR